MTEPDPRCPVSIPNEPDFSPADVVALLPGRTEADVRYWITHHKLYARRTWRGKWKISRAELVRFCRDYLHCLIVSPPPSSS